MCGGRNYLVLCERRLLRHVALDAYAVKRDGTGGQGPVAGQDTEDGGAIGNGDAGTTTTAVKQVPDDTVSLDESLSPAEQAATAAEVFALSSAEQ
eukprot:COSAG06_NODE_37309_length_436_cov_8.611276_1_plen_94_part_01